jgi:hypothetical protein
MSGIDKYIRKATKSKREAFALPVIDSAEDAVRMAREAAASLQSLPDDQRLALLSDLEELSDAIGGRIDHLQQALAETGLKLQQARLSRKACLSYVQGASRAAPQAPDKDSVVVKLDARRRPPCP